MFYGWKLVWLGMLGNFMLLGGAFYIMNAFIEPLTVLRGWTRAEIGLCLGIASFIGALSMSLLGTLAMRVSLRTLMTGGAVTGGLAFIGAGQATSLVTFTLMFIGVWISAQACGGVVANALTARWFVKARGSAFGITNMGTSASGVIVPLLALVLVDTLGVPAAFGLVGGAVLLMAPLCWLMVKEYPADMGLHPDNAVQQPGSASQPREINVSVRSVLRDPNAWIIGITFGVGIMGINGVLSQLKPRFVDMGYASYTAMLLMCTMALFAGIGKVAWGIVCDKSDALISSKALFLCNATTLSLALAPQNAFTVGLFIVGYGLSCGGVYTLLPALIAQVYGKERFLSVYRVIVCFLLLKAFGFLIAGQSHALTGNYDAGYICLAVLLLCCFFSMWKLTPGPAHAGDPAVDIPA